MARQAKGKDWWLEELGYILDTDPQKPGHSFNSDRDCYGRYVEMQARNCRADGWPTLADAMLTHFNNN